MKKALIAGAASAVLAAMPLVGAFAAPVSVGNNGSLTDNFTVTINHSCTMSRVSHTAGRGAGNAVVDWNSPSRDADTLALGAITAGAIYSMGSSTFNVNCNGTNGYQVKAVVTNFAGPEADDNINAVDTAISAIPTGNSAWTAVSSYEPTAGSPVYATSTEGGDTVMANDDATANAGDEFTMTYNLGLKDGQASGSYTASVAYTLVDLTTNN